MVTVVGSPQDGSVSLASRYSGPWGVLSLTEPGLVSVGGAVLQKGHGVTSGARPLRAAEASTLVSGITRSVGSQLPSGKSSHCADESAWRGARSPTSSRHHLASPLVGLLEADPPAPFR